VSLGFGIWAGYPISFSAYYGGYGYWDPYYYGYLAPSYGYGYPYPAPYPAGAPYPGAPYPGAPYPAGAPYPGTSPYPPSAPPANYPPSGTVQPNQADLGGVSFEISPSDAQVFVDGSYIGTVGQFTPSTQPLGLTPGRHHLELHLDGYRTMSFDVDIHAGEVIPYQGTMER
jgi:hypothetical protein